MFRKTTAGIALLVIVRSEGHGTHVATSTIHRRGGNNQAAVAAAAASSGSCCAPVTLGSGHDRDAHRGGTLVKIGHTPMVKLGHTPIWIDSFDDTGRS